MHSYIYYTFKKIRYSRFKQGFGMKNFYTKLFMLTCIFGLPCMANLEQQIENGRRFIQGHHDERCAAFNDDFRDQTIVRHTNAIDTLLSDETRVHKVKMNPFDLRKHQKTILSAVMAKEFIGYTTQPQKARTSIYKKKQDSAHFKHFEILRLTEDLSYQFAAQITQEKAFNQYNLNRLIVGNYSQIFSYSGLTQAIFLDWFQEIFAMHNPGFIAKNTQQRHVKISRTSRSAAVQPNKLDTLQHKPAATQLDRFDIKPSEATRLRAAYIHDEHEAYLDDPDLQEALVLSLNESRNLSAPYAQASHGGYHGDTYVDLTEFSQEELAAQAELMRQFEQNRPAAVDQISPEEQAFAESFAMTSEIAANKITIFPVMLQDKGSGTLRMNVGDLLEPVFQNDGQEKMKLCSFFWEIQNYGDFIKNYKGNIDPNEIISPSIQLTTTEFIVTYRFKKADGTEFDLILKRYL